MFRDVLTPRRLARAGRVARAHRTPFYLFEPATLRREARDWARAAADSAPASVFYPYKCNRLSPVVALLAAEGLGAEVTTADDLRLARRRGIPAGRLVIQGPAKENGLIDEGLACDALFVADGVEDAGRILDRARALSKTPAYLLRIAVASARPEQHAFGLPARELVAFARALLARGRPRPRGLAFHLGTGLASNAPYLAAIAEAAGVARSLAAAGIPTSALDLGGGFAARTESRLDARGRPAGRGKAPSAILPALARDARRRFDPSLELLVEPGRALVSSSLHLVARVVTVKRSGRKRTVFLDASRLSHAFFVRQGRHAIAAIPAREGPRRLATLAGPLGVGVDVFAEEPFPPIEPGDLVVIGSVGAYNRNAGNPWAGAAPLVVPG